MVQTMNISQPILLNHGVGQLIRLDFGIYANF